MKPSGFAGVIPIDGITVVGQRVLALFVLATLLWTTELVPAYATSLLIIGLLAGTVSNNAPFPLRAGVPADMLFDYEHVLGSFASPIIILFMGGFFIASAASKYKLDINVARVLLKPIGSNYSLVLLGLMVITAVFSMFMSNTATTAMMLAILAPLMKNLEEGDPAAKAMVMGVPVAANLGGIGTPIGTPPNAIAFRYLVGEHSLSFGGWMLFAIPLACVLILISWIVLQKIYPARVKTIKVEINSTFEQSLKAYIVYATTVLTLVLWMTSGFHGMNSYVVALLPVVVFSMTGIIDAVDISRINWAVLWLIAGGIALGYGLSTSGLAEQVVHTLPMGTLGALPVLIVLSVLAMVMSTFMSNTATTNLLMPIAVSIGSAMTGVEEFGGLSLIVIGVGLSASTAMALPISTPPNALAHATGMVTTGDFFKTGKFISVIGLILVLITVISLGSIGYF
ncbi:DASS family sodium-coupled anion symporter [Sansalvadorimonas verongulae]|nr:DASS family sodium-coupled anion symporter [Sansalvadorimonas verongulae]